MFTYHSAYIDLSTALHAIYDVREASALAQQVLEHITGATRLERLTDKHNALTPEQGSEYDRIKPLLLQGIPLQYVLGTEWFMGRQFMVNEDVLIPRPETEELVQWIIDDNKSKEITILDIGTGSGCIPISLQLALPQSAVSAIDVSSGALNVAIQNATSLNANVDFRKVDFLDKTQWTTLGIYDVIVSNPPYIPETESNTLHTNVRDHEPGLALFVPGNDALLFYRNIAEFGLSNLKENGIIYCELHVDYAIDTQALFTAMGYRHTELRKDMHGNLRMLKAQK